MNTTRKLIVLLFVVLALSSVGLLMYWIGHLEDIIMILIIGFFMAIAFFYKFIKEKKYFIKAKKYFIKKWNRLWKWFVPLEGIYKIIIFLIISVGTVIVIDRIIYFDRETLFWVSSTIIQAVAALIALFGIFYVLSIDGKIKFKEQNEIEIEKIKRRLESTSLPDQERLDLKGELSRRRKKQKRNNRKIEKAKLALKYSLRRSGIIMSLTLLLLASGKFTFKTNFFNNFTYIPWIPLAISLDIWFTIFLIGSVIYYALTILKVE